MFTSIIFYDLWGIILLYKETLRNILINWILYQHTISSIDIQNLINLFLSIFLVWFTLMPFLLFKNLKNAIWEYSINIVLNMQEIFKVWIFKIEENRDKIVKVIYFSIINLMIVLFYHWTLQILFFQWQINILKTLLYWMILISWIIIYTNTLYLYVKNITKNNIIESRKELYKIIYTVILYWLWMMLILILWEYISTYIYNIVNWIPFISTLLK